ncbi:MAG: hypothetical protein QOE23_3828 [Pseudonocardiales bacterium]|jgi:peptidoglycan biosynthesis protein MviN/MurJ (putative lipid II flippase)|nr:hypothetical protein [Pseudonocardiales bacterium]
MTAIFYLLVGMVLALGTIIGLVVYLTVTNPGMSKAQLARLEQLRAERRLHRITQDAVAQMLDIARGRQ